MQQTLPAPSASLVGLARQGVFLVPLLFIFPACFGFLGPEICQPVSDCFAFPLTVPMQIPVFSDLRKAELLYSQNLQRQDFPVAKKDLFQIAQEGIYPEMRANFLKSSFLKKKLYQ